MFAVDAYVSVTYQTDNSNLLKQLNFHSISDPPENEHLRQVVPQLV